jgi:hypothetical protein
MMMHYARLMLALALSLVPAGSSDVVAGQQDRVVEWSLSSSPVVTIGGGDDPRETLSRVVSLARLRTGDVLVWEPRPAAVRLFGAKGRFSRIFAREGAGPGEVRDAIWIGVTGDTVFLFDRTQRRLTRFRSTGQVLSVVPFRPVGSDQGYAVIGRWRDGTLILRSQDAGFSGRGADGIRRDSVWLAIADSGGGGLRQLVRFPGTASFTRSTPGGGVFVARQPIGPEGLTAVGDDVAWVGDNATPIVVGYDRSGRPARRVRVPFEPTPIDERVLGARRMRELETVRSPAAQALVNAKYAAAPPRNPYYTGLAVAPDGDLWVTGAPPNDSVGAHVAVFSPDGRIRARLLLPARFRIVQVDDGLLTGILRDEDDVEFVRVYSIRR